MLWENSIKRCILSRVKQITSPGWMHETSVQGWCTGKTKRDEVGREVGGGIGMGNTCKSLADSCQCMAKPLQYCKVGSLQGIEGYFNKNKWGKIEKKKGSKSGWRLTEKSVIYLIIFLQTLCWLPNNYRTKFKMLKWPKKVSMIRLFTSYAASPPATALFHFRLLQH